MRLVNPGIPELSWEKAAELLSANGGDVNKACYAVQCEWLQPLYQSISSEHYKPKQMEMQEIKLIISRKDIDFSKEVLYDIMPIKFWRGIESDGLVE